jgi:hypothetical protein
MKQYNVLFEDKWFQVVDVEGQIGLKNKEMSVAIMPYRVNELGVITEIGLLKELNYFREGNYAQTLITGTIEKEDDSLLLAAKRELLEEGGFELTEDDNERWLFLGPVYLYKTSDQMIPVFAVDVTGVEQRKADGDGSVKEEKSELEMVEIGNGISSSEALVLSSFLKLFNYMYAKTLNYV